MSQDFNDFNLDDFSLDDSSGVDEDSFDNDFDNSEDSDDFGDLSNTELADKKETRRVSFVAIICGILLIVVVFLLVGFITKISNRAKNEDTTTNNDNQQIVTGDNQQIVTGDNQQIVTGDNQQIVTGDNQSKPVENQQIQQSTSQNQNSSQEWISFSSADGVTFSNDYVSSTFSVTSIKHYVKVVDSDNLMVKTILTGALSGFTGTYEIEVPFSKGNLLTVGKSFDVSVQVGTNSSGKTIVGEIKY